MNDDRDHSVEDDIVALLRAAGLPAADDLRLTAEEEARTDAVARAALLRIVATPRATTPRRRSRVPRLVVTYGTVAAVTALLVALVVQPWRDPSAPGDPTAPQADGRTPALAQFSLAAYDGTTLVDGEPGRGELERLADLADEQPARGSGPVQHLARDGWYLSEFGEDQVGIIPTYNDVFYLPDGTVRSLEYAGTPLDVNGRIPGGDTPAQPTADETFPGPRQGPDYADGLPTDPAALVAELIPDPTTCSDPAYCLGRQILSLHESWVVQPRLAAALWRGLAEQPGVTFLGQTLDRTGRPSVGFSVSSGDGSVDLVLYVDPQTGLLQGSDMVLLTRRVVPGQDPEVELPAVGSFTSIAANERVAASAVP